MSLNSSDIIRFIIESGLLSSIIALLLKGINIAAKYLENKIGNDQYNKYIDEIEKAINTAVIAINQTYVDTLKETGTFDKSAQKESFELAKQKSLTILSGSTKQALSEVFGDLNAYISDRIEYYVKQAKAGKY